MTNVKYVNDFVALEKTARKNNKGLWEHEKAIDPTIPVIVDKTKNPTGPIGNKETSQYIGSLKSDKYHLPGYTHNGQIVDLNLIYFESKDHAIANGYVPCGICFRQNYEVDVIRIKYLYVVKIFIESIKIWRYYMKDKLRMQLENYKRDNTRLVKKILQIL